jgi:hypothetical protein
MINMTDRRRYPRYPAHYDVTYKNIDDTSSVNHHATAENVSRLGIKMHFAGQLNKNDIIHLQIYKPLDPEPINAIGKVVWKGESPLVYGEKVAGISLTKVGWTETGRLIAGTSDT